MVVGQSIVAFQMTTKKSHDAQTPDILNLERYVKGMPLIFILLVCKEREHEDISCGARKVYGKAIFFISSRHYIYFG